MFEIGIGVCSWGDEAAVSEIVRQGVVGRVLLA